MKFLMALVIVLVTSVVTWGDSTHKASMTFLVAPATSYDFDVTSSGGGSLSIPSVPVGTIPVVYTPSVFNGNVAQLETDITDGASDSYVAAINNQFPDSFTEVYWFPPIPSGSDVTSYFVEILSITSDEPYLLFQTNFGVVVENPEPTAFVLFAVGCAAMLLMRIRIQGLTSKQ